MSHVVPQIIDIRENSNIYAQMIHLQSQAANQQLLVLYAPIMKGSAEN